MPTGVWKITDIPKDKVAIVVANFKADVPAPTIAELIQTNGLWTVKATFPGDDETEKTFDPKA